MGPGVSTSTTQEPQEISLEWLWTESRPQVRAILANARVPPEDGEDLLQDILTRFLGLQYQVRDPVAWLVTSVRFAVLSYWRARRTSALKQFDQILENRLAADPVDRVWRCDVERCLEEMSEQCREMIRLRYGLGLEPIEVAPRIGYTTRGVRKVTRRCLDGLAARLTEGGYEWPRKKS